MQQRIAEIDYLKGVMIILVVMFHLVAMDMAYPTVRMAVYTFHVPVFLIISGYLTNINKNPKDYGKSLLRLIVPYIVFETVYMLLLHSLGEGVNATLSMDALTLQDIAIRLLVYPIGAYWYLQVLIVCGIIYYIVFHFLKMGISSKFLLMSTVVYVIAYLVRYYEVVPIMAGSGFVWESVLFFLLGVLVRLSGIPFTKVFPASWFALVPLILLFSSRDHLFRGTLPGVFINVLMVCFLLFAFKHIGNQGRSLLGYLGRNSLAIYVFSPFFVGASKFAEPFFHFDSSMICYAITATFISIMASLGCSYLSDRLHLTRWLFCSERIYY